MTPPCSRNVLHMVYVENLIYERLYVWLMQARLNAYAGRIEYTYDLVETADSKTHRDPLSAGDGVRGRCQSEVEQKLFARPEGSSLHVREDAGTESPDCTLTGKKYAVGASEIEAESRACQDCRWHDGVWVFDCGAHIMYTS